MLYYLCSNFIRGLENNAVILKTINSFLCANAVIPRKLLAPHLLLSSFLLLPIYYCPFALWRPKREKYFLVCNFIDSRPCNFGNAICEKSLYFLCTGYFALILDWTLLTDTKFATASWSCTIMHAMTAIPCWKWQWQ